MEVGPFKSMASWTFFLTLIITKLCFNQGFGPSSSSSFGFGRRSSRTMQQHSALQTLGGEQVMTDGDKLFNFYSLEGGMCPYAGMYWYVTAASMLGRGNDSETHRLYSLHEPFFHCETARTWITLLELGIPFELIEVNRQEKDWYLKINPRGKVPALQNLIDGNIIYESAICDEYLCDYARQMEGERSQPPPGPTPKVWKLMPVDAAKKAAMRLLNDHTDTQLGPAQFTYLMNNDKDKDQELLEKIEKALAVLEDALQSSGGPYLMGEEFTLADIHVLPFFLRLVVTFEHFKGYKLSEEMFPRLLAWFDLCSAKESVKATSKSKERIIEVYEKFFEMNYSFGGLNKNK